MRSPRYSARLSVAMTQREAIDVFRGCWPEIPEPAVRKRGEHQPIYQMDIERGPLRRILVALEPFLRLKAERARLGISLLDLLAESRTHRTKAFGKHIFKAGRNAGSEYTVYGLSEDFLAACEALYQGSLARKAARSGDGVKFR